MQVQAIQGYRLSPQQKRLWLLQQSTDHQPYRAQCAVLIEGVLDSAALKAALEEGVSRNQILRTTFRSSYGLTVPVQVIGDIRPRVTNEFDLRKLPKKDRIERIEEILRGAMQLPLDCERGPVMHASLVTVSQDEHLLIVTLPALCADSDGLINIVREISSSYAASVSGKEIGAETMQYIIASEWQNDLFETEDFEVGKKFWRQQNLSGFNALELPFGRQSDPELTFEPRLHSLALGVRDGAKIEAVAARQGVSVSTFLLTCWHILLGRLTGQSQILVGVGFKGRTDKEMEEAVGLFAKYLPIRSHLDDQLELGELLQQIHASGQEVDGWQEWFIWDQLEGVPPDQAHALFFPVCFDFDEGSAEYQASGLTFSMYKCYACTDRFELKLRCVRAKESLVTEFHYNSALFTAAEIELLASQYQKLVESAIDNPDAAVADLEMLTDRERRQLLENNARSEYAYDSCMQELFTSQVERTPDAIAAVYENYSLTYDGLNRRANQLAHRLRKEGVGPEALVPFCVDRSLEVVVGLLGILKAGAAYVPVDPAYPVERLAFMLQDARAAVLVTKEKFAATFADQEIKRISLDADLEDLCQESEEDISSGAAAENMAYVIYTSGSTGKPKGVMVEHRSVNNLLAALGQAIGVYRYESPLAVSLNAPLAFDASVQQLAMLMRGDTLHIIPQEIRTDGKALLSYLADGGVDVFDCTPSQLEILLGAGLMNPESPAPRAVLVAGEAIDESTWKRLASATGTAFYNIYGPTECTVDASFCVVRESPDRPSIGEPLANYRLYVLDRQLGLAPIGSSSELYIGGAGVTRGYLNQPALTAERYVPDTFSGLAGARLYKTGDLVRRFPDGKIEFLRRLDEQVKVRGYRIEPGEIESVLGEHSLVRQCAVCVREDEPGDKRVVAYIVAAHETAPAAAELREYLQAKLPRYMIPSAFVVLTHLPLTSNGKLDRKALPAPETNATEHTMPPRDSTELYLFQVWSDVLGTEQFGIRDNFFDLGGHSLTAVTLSSRVSETYREKMSVRTVFDHPTIEQMATYLRRVAFVPPAALVPIQPRGTRPPFFCVHPAGGLAHVYIKLARCLGPDQPFYGLQSRGLDTDSIAAPTIEEMATQYLAEVRCVLRSGPYQIGGWSSGAVVAYEMAQQLHAAGEEVSLLAVLDASLPSDPVDDRPLNEEQMQAALHEVVVGYSKRNLALAAEDARVMSTRDLIQMNMSHHKQMAREKELAGIMDLTETHYLRWFRNWANNTLARNRYRARPYPGHVTLFRGNNSREHDYGWGQWALGGVDVFYFDAEHPTFVDEPNAAVLAAQLSNCFAAADR